MSQKEGCRNSVVNLRRMTFKKKSHFIMHDFNPTTIIKIEYLSLQSSTRSDSTEEYSHRRI